MVWKNGFEEGWLCGRDNTFPKEEEQPYFEALCLACLFVLSLLSMPNSVRQRIEQIQRDFLWRGGTLERKSHLVRWEIVCLDKKKGGLGVKCFSTLNKALLCKWNWQLANERKTLWNKAIKGKYGEESGGWCPREVREVYGVGLWKGIRKDWDFVRTRISFSMGNGWRVRFWKDKWCGTLLCAL